MASLRRLSRFERATADKRRCAERYESAATRRDARVLRGRRRVMCLREGGRVRDRFEGAVLMNV